jgi:glycosyltransferase involved in cell wall biosynthesis
MRILYSLAHPSDTLESERAGHVVRARALLDALEQRGHEVVRVEAATAATSQVSVATYRNVLRRYFPQRVARAIRDVGRLQHSNAHRRRLSRAIRHTQPDVLLETYSPMNVSGAAIARRDQIPLVIDDFAPSWEDDEVYGRGIDWLSRWARRRLLEQASVVVAVNGFLRQSFRDEGLENDRIVVVQNGVSEEFLSVNAAPELRAKLGFRPSDVVFVFAGSFQPFHRVDLLIEAFSRVRSDHARLLLVGDGNALADVRNQVTRLGLDDKVVIAGQVPHKDVASYLAASDAGVLPATEEYTNPMKVIEYLAVGCPVVAPQVRAIEGLVTDDRDALLFAPLDADSLSTALERFSSDAGLRERMTEHASQSPVRGHSWQEAGDALADALASAVGREHSPVQ